MCCQDPALQHRQGLAVQYPALQGFGSLMPGTTGTRYSGTARVWLSDIWHHWDAVIRHCWDLAFRHSALPGSGNLAPPGIGSWTSSTTRIQCSGTTGIQHSGTTGLLLFAIELHGTAAAQLTGIIGGGLDCRHWLDLILRHHWRRVRW